MANNTVLKIIMTLDAFPECRRDINQYYDRFKPEKIINFNGEPCSGLVSSIFTVYRRRAAKAGNSTIIMPYDSIILSGGDPLMLKLSYLNRFCRLMNNTFKYVTLETFMTDRLLDHRISMLPIHELKIYLQDKNVNAVNVKDLKFPFKVTMSIDAEMYNKTSLTYVNFQQMSKNHGYQAVEIREKINGEPVSGLIYQYVNFETTYIKLIDRLMGYDVIRENNKGEYNLIELPTDLL